MYKRILVPLDGSETAQRGLLEAIELAKQLNASLQLLHVITDVTWLADPYMLGNPPALVKEFTAAGEAVLNKAETLCRENGVVVQKLVREAHGRHTGRVIVEEVGTSGCNLVVMGTHGRRGVGRLMLGSDAAEVVTACPVPVLLVRLEAAHA